MNDYFDKIKKLRLLDDVFLRACLNENKAAVQLILRIIMQKPDLEVVRFETQKDLKNLNGRSIVADIVAEDSDNTVYNIEIERSSARTNPFRMRYHSSVIDSNNFKEGMDFKELPDSYVIFIAEDMNKELQGLPYVTARTYYEYPNKLIPMNDNRNYIIVNAEYRGEDDFGKLMNDFRAREVDNMIFPELKEKAKHFKEEEVGIKQMSSEFDDYIEEIVRDKVRDKDKKAAKKMFLDGIKLKKVAQYCPSLKDEELIEIQNEVLNPA